MASVLCGLQSVSEFTLWVWIWHFQTGLFSGGNEGNLSETSLAPKEISVRKAYENY